MINHGDDGFGSTGCDCHPDVERHLAILSAYAANFASAPDGRRLVAKYDAMIRRALAEWRVSTPCRHQEERAKTLAQRLLAAGFSL